jgi:hypothetical protein
MGQTRPKIGDVIEIPTSRGLAYAQYTHYVPRWGALLRILPGIFDARPDDWETFVQQDERFYAFFPLGAALSRDIVSVVAKVEVPNGKRTFPRLRMRGLVDPATRRATSWRIWDGKAERLVTSLTDEERSLSVAAVLNDAMLTKKIEEGYKPEDEL